MAGYLDMLLGAQANQETGGAATPGLIANLAGRQGAPQWLTGANDWLSNQGGGQFMRGLMGAYPQMRQRAMDEQYNLSAIDPRVANPYAGILNQDRERELGMVPTGGGGMGGGGGQFMQTILPYLQQAAKQGAFKGLWDSMFKPKDGGAGA